MTRSFRVIQKLHHYLNYYFIRHRRSNFVITPQVSSNFKFKILSPTKSARLFRSFLFFKNLEKAINVHNLDTKFNEDHEN